MSLELQDELTRELRENPQHRGRVIVHACPTFWAMWTATLVHHDGTLGRSANARVVDPDAPTRCFEWLLEEARDEVGNLTQVLYAHEDRAGAPNTPAEAARRLPGNTPTFVYPKLLRYGNRTPFAAAPLAAADFFVEVVFDYGEHTTDTVDVLGVCIASRFSDEAIVDEVQQHLAEIARDRQSVRVFFGYEFVLPRQLLGHAQTAVLLHLPTRDHAPIIPAEAALLSHNELQLVASDLPCVRNVVHHPEFGLVPPGSWEAAMVACEQALLTPSEARRAGHEAWRRRAQSEWNLLDNFTSSILLASSPWI